MPKFKANNTQNKRSLTGIGANKRALDHLNDLVIFSYKYLCLDNEKFDISERDTTYFIKLKERLKNISSMTAHETRSTPNKTLRFHPIDWNDHRLTETCFGIPNEEQIAYEPRQFSISVNEHGRVHGFYIDNVFYIRWFDPNHNLYD